MIVRQSICGTTKANGGLIVSGVQKRVTGLKPWPETGQIGVDLRVAVTGHRWVDEHDPILVGAVEDALRYLRARCSNTSTPHTRVGMAVASSLAEGADRLVARVGLEQNLYLDAVLPLAAQDYRKDFKTNRSKVEFDELLRAAASRSLTQGTEPRRRSAAYAAAGRQLLARCDVLLALWDGRPAGGEGGTAEVYALARRLKIPIYWIKVVRTGSQVAVSVAHRPDEVGVLGDEAFKKLDWFNSRVVRAVSDNASVDGFPTRGAFGRYALSCFRRADEVSSRMQRRSRATSRVVYLLSLIAVGVVAGQVIFADGRPEIAWLEFLALAVIVVVLVQSRHAQYLERWISTRYLAERMRSLAFLAELTQDKTIHPVDLDPPLDDPMEEWIRRALNELWMRSPAPAAWRQSPKHLRHRLVKDWLEPQITYQDRTHRIAKRHQQAFNAGTLTLFVLSVVAAFVHSTAWLHNEHHADYLGFISLIVPASAAALSGYAAQRDFSRQLIRSATMSGRLRKAAGDLERAQDLAELRHLALRVDLILQGESADWYTAVRLHEVEVP